MNNSSVRLCLNICFSKKHFVTLKQTEKRLYTEKKYLYLHRWERIYVSNYKNKQFHKQSFLLCRSTYQGKQTSARPIN